MTDKYICLFIASGRFRISEGAINILESLITCSDICLRPFIIGVAIFAQRLQLIHVRIGIKRKSCLYEH